MTRAASLGAQEAGKPVSGIQLLNEAESADEEASYLPEGNHVVCKFSIGRKVHVQPLHGPHPSVYLDLDEMCCPDPVLYFRK